MIMCMMFLLDYTCKTIIIARLEYHFIFENYLYIII